LTWLLCPGQIAAHGCSGTDIRRPDFAVSGCVMMMISARGRMILICCVRPWHSDAVFWKMNQSCELGVSCGVDVFLSVQS
jgi:hypothetical protein